MVITSKKGLEILNLASNFFIGEIGFGIGLNFLTTCKNWLNIQNIRQVLNFYLLINIYFNCEDFKEITNF